MDQIMKMLVDNAIDKDIAKWLADNNDGNDINADEVYFAHTVLVNEQRETSEEEFRVLIDSSIRTPHNRFFVDVINHESMGSIYGWTGFGMVPNLGRCVDAADALSKKIGKSVVSFEEMKEYVDEQNKGVRKERSK